MLWDIRKLIPKNFWGYPQVNPQAIPGYPDEILGYPKLLPIGEWRSCESRLAIRVRDNGKYPRTMFTTFTRPFDSGA